MGFCGDTSKIGRIGIVITDGVVVVSLGENTFQPSVSVDLPHRIGDTGTVQVIFSHCIAQSRHFIFDRYLLPFDVTKRQVKRIAGCIPGEMKLLVQRICEFRLAAVQISVPHFNREDKICLQHVIPSIILCIDNQRKVFYRFRCDIEELISLHTRRLHLPLHRIGGNRFSESIDRPDLGRQRIRPQGKVVVGGVAGYLYRRQRRQTQLCHGLFCQFLIFFSSDGKGKLYQGMCAGHIRPFARFIIIVHPVNGFLPSLTILADLDPVRLRFRRRCRFCTGRWRRLRGGRRFCTGRWLRSRRRFPVSVRNRGF